MLSVLQEKLLKTVYLYQKSTRVLENKELQRVHPSLFSWKNPFHIIEKVWFTFSSVKEERIITHYTGLFGREWYLGSHQQ